MAKWMFLCVACCSFLVQAAPPGAGASSVQKNVIADGIYQFITPYDGYVIGTSTAIVNENDVLVFDTNTRPSEARVVLAEIRKITSKPIRFVVNSHSHPDHWSGNEVYAQAFPGLQIIATNQALQIMQAVAPAWAPSFAGLQRRNLADFETRKQSGKNPDGTPFTAEQRRQLDEELRLFGKFAEETGQVHRVYPNLTFGDQLTLHSGPREFRFLNCFGDATGEAVLYLPKEKVLLTGDVLVYPRPYLPNSNQIVPWIESLKTLSGLDVDVIIPGHGPALHDKIYLNLVVELLESVVRQVRTALEQGAVTIEETQRTVKVESLEQKFSQLDNQPDFSTRFRSFVDRLSRKIYLEARDGREFTR